MLGGMLVLGLSLMLRATGTFWGLDHVGRYRRCTPYTGVVEKQSNLPMCWL
jgi:hypothetical protein